LISCVPTWHAARRYGRDAWKSLFGYEYRYDLAEHRYDLADSPGYEPLMRMRDMMQLTGPGPLLRAGTDQRYFAFLRQRLAGIRTGGRTAQWLTL
jgi:hypothetical protein